MRAAVCHCGTTRERALEVAAAQATAAPRDGRARAGGGLPRDVRALLVAAAICLVAGLGWAAFGPATRDTTRPLLGWADPQMPAPVRRQPPPPPRPPFRLPWWK